MLRQTQQEEDENLRHELDNELDSIRSLLFTAPPAPGPSTESKASAPIPDTHTPDNQDKEYDQYVRELALDRRAKPKDRTKAEEEVALEEKEVLEKAERRRLRRMNGEESESEDEGKGRRKQARIRGGDDLDDDFVDEDGSAWGGLGAGLKENVAMSSDGEDDEDGAEEESDEGGEDGEEESDEEGEDGSVAEEFESASEESGEESGEEGEEEALVKPSRKRPAKRSATVKELPYTFPCPETHEEFLEIIEDIDDNDVPMVLKRIRTLHHPSLAEENKFKLQVRLILHFLPAMPDFDI